MISRRPGSLLWIVFFVYQAIAVAMTWPLALGLRRDVPGDLGDPLLNLWILAWGAEQVPKLLTGQATWADYWNANIFHPEPLALGFSEHLFGQVLQVLPVYHLTGNIIFSYNLLFLTSFSLSGLGMFLLVRELFAVPSVPTLRSLAPAFIAGLVYAFVPFRLAQLAHLQSLSSQWMPLALFGFVRFVHTTRRRPLVGGTAALTMQHWSCGYYLLYFAPFVPLVVMHQMWRRGRLRHWRVWISLIGAAAAVTLATWPFLTLYLETQRVHGLARPLGEVMSFSADVYSYFTAPGGLHLWGRGMQAIPKPEGELFMGLVPLGLAVAASVAGVCHHRTALSALDSPIDGSVGRGWQALWLVRGLSLLLMVQLCALLLIVLTGGFITSVAGIPLRATNASRIFWNATLMSVVLLAVSVSARRHAGLLMRSPLVVAAILMVFAIWMSLGPVPHSRGQLLQVPALYWLFYEYVPGFGGLRVPARYGMVVALFLSIVAAGGALAIARARHGALILASLAVVFLLEVSFAPMPVNLSWGGNFVTPPSRVEPASDAPAVYQHLATMPDATVIAEFPFGDISWELRYVYYSTVHWKRLVNGYSGGFPDGYKARVALFERVGQHSDAAWRALRDAGTTHVIVHEQALNAAEGQRISQWLADHFAVEIARFNDDVLYDVDGKFDFAPK